MKNLLFRLVLASLLPVAAWAQEPDDDDHQTEFLYGANFNTNGGLFGGVVFRYSTTLNEKMKQTFGVEIVNVKHPQEIKSMGRNSGNTYVFGKNNYLFVVRPQYGREVLLFRKAAEEGVRISAVGAAGPSFGIVKPYYIAYDLNPNEPVIEQYDPARHQNRNNIIGSAAFSRMEGTRVALGVNAKAGLSFEIGGFRTSATGFEVGTLFEAFTRKIEMIPLAENRSMFWSVYLNIYFKNKH